MQFLKGGELYQHLRKKKKFNENQVKFITACLITSLGHLHNKNFLYRDLKPENILFDEKGYVFLSDFGSSIFLEEKFTLSFCGTAEYLAPERILGREYGREADWWSLGILVFELLFGLPPFYCKDKKKMFERSILEKICFEKYEEKKKKIKKKNCKLVTNDEENNENVINFVISDDCKDFIKELLRKSPKNRLGSKNGSLDIISHKWFKNFDWKNLLDKNLKPPFCPLKKNEDFLDNFDSEFVKEFPEDSFCNEDFRLLEKYRKDFDGFSFVRDNISFGEISENEKKINLKKKISKKKILKKNLKKISEKNLKKKNENFFKKSRKKKKSEKSLKKKIEDSNKKTTDTQDQKLSKSKFEKKSKKNFFFESQINNRIKKNNLFENENKNLKKKNKNKRKILKFLNKEKIKKNISLKNLKKKIIMKSIFNLKKKKLEKNFRSKSFQKIFCFYKKRISLSIDGFKKRFVKVK